MTKLLLQFRFKTEGNFSYFSSRDTRIHFSKHTDSNVHVTAAHSGQRFSWPLQKVTSRGSSIASEKNNKELSRNKRHIREMLPRVCEGRGTAVFRTDWTRRFVSSWRRNDVFVTSRKLFDHFIVTCVCKWPDGITRVLWCTRMCANGRRVDRVVIFQVAISTVRYQRRSRHGRSELYTLRHGRWPTETILTQHVYLSHCVH